jgi:hypothetical protein
MPWNDVGAAPQAPQAPAPAASGGWSDVEPATNPVGNTIHAILGAAAKGAGTLGRVLDTPRWATAVGTTGLTNPDAQRAEYRRRLGISDSYAQDPHWWQGLVDAGVDTITDPSVVFGGPILRGAAKGVKLASEAAMGIKPVAAAAEHVAPLGNWVHDQFTFAGPEVREFGQSAVDQAVGAKAKASTNQQQLDALLQQKLQNLRAPLSEQDWNDVLAVRNGQKSAMFPGTNTLNVSPAALKAANDLKALTDQAALLRPNANLTKILGFDLSGPKPPGAKTIMATRTPPGPTFNPNAAAGSIDDLVAAAKADTDRFLKDGGAKMLPEDGPRIGLSPAATLGVKSGKYTVKAMAPGPTQKMLEDALGPDLLPFKVPQAGVDPATGAFVRDPYRKFYVPGPREAKAVDEANRPAFTHDPFDPFDPNLEHRVNPFQVGGVEENQKFTDALSNMLSSTARNVSDASLRNDLAHRLGVAAPADIPDALKKLTRTTYQATGNERTPEQAAQDVWRSLISLPKQAVVGTSPRHIFNIAGLQAVADPGSIPGTVKDTLNILAHPDQRDTILSDLINKYGAGGPEFDRTTPVADFLAKLNTPTRAAGGAAIGGTSGALSQNPDHSEIDPGERLRRILTGAAVGAGTGAVAPSAMQFFNKATWAYDDAAVQRMAQGLEKKGLATGYDAGRQARRSLVDYTNVSPFTEAAKNALPFATFNTQIPGAVLSAVAKNPVRTEALNRLSGGALLGGDVQPGGPGGDKVRLYNPPAEIGRMDVPGFVRKSLADPIKMGIDAAGFDQGTRRVGGKVVPQHFWTYGQNTHNPVDLLRLLINMGAGSLPEARTVLQQAGYGPFPARPWLDELLQSSTGVRVSTPKGSAR